MRGGGPPAEGFGERRAARSGGWTKEKPKRRVAAWAGMGGGAGCLGALRCGVEPRGGQGAAVMRCARRWDARAAVYRPSRAGRAADLS